MNLQIVHTALTQYHWVAFSYSSLKLCQWLVIYYENSSTGPELICLNIAVTVNFVLDNTLGFINVSYIINSNGACLKKGSLVNMNKSQ